MNAETAAGPRAGSSSSSRGRRRGRAQLAALPNPVEQAKLAAEGDRRARERLAQADADGAPLLNRAGKRRSPITLPEYQRGRAPGNKGRQFPIEVLNPTEVRALLAALPKRGKTGIRNRALIVMLYRVGLRVAETLDLEPKDVDLELGAVTVLSGKGAKRRVVGIDRASRPYIAAWLAERDRLGISDTGPLFCTVTRDAGGIGRSMHSSCVREMLKDFGRKAGITKRCTPHGMRHSGATAMALEGIPVPLIQEQLGHEDMAMTQHYIRRLLPSDLVNRIAIREWAGEPTIAAKPMTSVALSVGAPVALESPPAPLWLDPPEPEPLPRRKPGPGQGAQRVLDTIISNGGSATQAQLRRALGLSRTVLLGHLHRLHANGQITRAGLDLNRSIIWKVAPPPVVMRPVRELRCAPNGEGPRRVLDAVDALGGRGSQAELARLLELSPSTVHDHCRALEANGQLTRAGLDKSTSRRGSQVWRVPPPRSRYQTAGGYSMRLPAP